MARTNPVVESRLFLPSLQAPEPGSGEWKRRLDEMERLCRAAEQEIAMLTDERDELVSAIKQWAKADRSERHELLLEVATLELRTELKHLRQDLKRLKRENTSLNARLASQDEARKMRA